MTDTDALKSQIRLAFSNVEPPPQWCLASGNEGTEPALLAQEFGAVLDRNWEELDPAFLDQAPGGFGSALSFFSDEAFRFPALQWSNPREAKGEIDAGRFEFRIAIEPDGGCLAMRCSLRADYSQVIQQLCDRFGWVAFDEAARCFQPARPTMQA